ncbi:MAG: AAA family ATPase [Burkholderiales bacterium]|nr:AAA family ATPase [Burkholderiales bacterium]
MIKNVHIRGFKCFDDEVIDFSNLTVITGPNSSGKSSLLQALLINLNHSNMNDAEIQRYVDDLGTFIDLKNKKTNPDKFSIDIKLDTDRLISYFRCLESPSVINGYGALSKPLTPWYLSANRRMLSETGFGAPSELSCGIFGENISSYYHSRKDDKLEDNLIINKTSANTLESQVNYWLSYICSSEISVFVDQITTTVYRSYYKIDNQEYKPQNLGAGVSYLISVIVRALLMPKSNFDTCCFIIENPEIHLHPKSQARLAEFFAFVARTGRQIIIETHSEHLISKLRYCIYNKQIEASQVVIQYRQPDKFEKIEILPNGKLLNETGEHSFPRGFFDATLDNIFEINSNV